MNIPLLILNIAFYLIILVLYGEAQRDPSASLGIGFVFVFIFIFFPVLQFILWRVKIIRVTTIVDKIGMLTATPLIPIVVFLIAARVNAAFYKSVDTVCETSPHPETDEWVKDSTWFYFSESGDTIRKEVYRNDTLIRSYNKASMSFK